MAEKYIRIYCNEKKIRSTGHNKWYRDYELKQFGYIDGRGKDEIRRYMLEQSQSLIEKPDIIDFDVEFVRKTKTGGKIIDKTVHAPYILVKKSILFAMVDHVSRHDDSYDIIRRDVFLESGIGLPPVATYTEIINRITEIEKGNKK